MDILASIVQHVIIFINHEGDIRLTGGRNNSEGNVEIYHNGTWGAICDKYFDEEDAIVFCRQLGFATLVDIYCCSTFDRYQNATNQKTIYWVDNLDCTGYETHINQCLFTQWQNDKCSGDHFKDLDFNCKIALDLFVRVLDDPCLLLSSCQHGQCKMDDQNAAYCECYKGYTGEACDIVDSCFSSPCPLNATCVNYKKNGYSCMCPQGYYGKYCHQGIVKDSDIRLINKTSPSEGVLQIYKSGRWTEICVRSFNYAEANVACYQLGYLGAVSGHCCQFSVSRTDSKICTNSFRCHGTEKSIANCQQIKQSNQVTQVDVSIRCTNNPCLIQRFCVHGKCRPLNRYRYECLCDAGFTGQRCDQANQINGSIRLAGGRTEWQGRLEMIYRGRWLPVCPHEFNVMSALVSTVCKQLTNWTIGNYSFCRDTDGYSHGQRYPYYVICYHHQKSLNQCTQIQSHNARSIGKKCSHGRKCSDVICIQCLGDPCRSSPCIHGRCQANEKAYRCICSPNYIGQHCQQYDYCAQHQCSFNSTCINLKYGLVCQCPNGYYGINCQNDNPCSIYGRDCSLHGHCLTINQSTYQCVCDDSYYGRNCEFQDTGLNFMNSNNKNKSATNASQQSYSNQKSIIQCLQRTLGLPCASSPCSHFTNATCIDVTEPFISYTCLCPNGYYNGEKCVKGMINIYSLNLLIYTLIDLDIPATHIQIRANTTSISLSRSIKLECTAYGLPPPSLTWWKNDLMLSDNESQISIIKFSSSYRSKLVAIIENSTSMDNGSYWCQASNHLNQMKANQIIELGNCFKEDLCAHGYCYTKNGYFYCNCSENYTGNYCEKALCLSNSSTCTLGVKCVGDFGNTGCRHRSQITAKGQHNNMYIYIHIY
ncbi:Scavenger receptor cysteine-rich domain superfamily protein [Trichoplax sp. H2]|nr:Scavenger receptor cysteine-rich domain superfamily protein [Trichoplax sp. H2]|eukprot:RDD36070.1 Scavenger receptor cysteine-rich domain superfamily protein [Trichoplax sp. H2]